MGGYPPGIIDIKPKCKGRQDVEEMKPIQEEKKRNGAPGRSRTSDLLVRSQLLYPAELRAHIAWGCNPLRILEFAAQSKRLQCEPM